MSSVKPLKPRESIVRQWLKEAGEGKRRLLISPHAQERMKERKIGRRQVLETLKHGTISEPLHKDVRGDSGAAMSAGAMQACASRWAWC
ncbi:MAG: DUF4258 domain-containing protein [Rhodocyclaceae bacterium]|nr:DUF4258 domain-containing protein [Rhodocyclaceae bacterium]